MMGNHISVADVEDHYPEQSWQRLVFADLKSTLTSTSRPFPCVFGASAIKSRQLRVAFVDPLTPDHLGSILRDYLTHARDYGRMTSLVVFARPGPVRDMKSYEDQLWTLLDGMERTDTTPRPPAIPAEIDHPNWEFCYAGEPIFVSCATPAHVLRASRRSATFMAVFQPRWIFKGIMDSDEPAVQRSLHNIRDRIMAYDAVPVFPYLGSYGNPEAREHVQYFIYDTNERPACPFHQLGQTNRPNEGEVA